MGFNEWMQELLFGEAGGALQAGAEKVGGPEDPGSIDPPIAKPGFDVVFKDGRYYYVPKPTQPIQPAQPSQSSQVDMMVEALKFWKPMPK